MEVRQRGLLQYPMFCGGDRRQSDKRQQIMKGGDAWKTKNDPSGVGAGTGRALEKSYVASIPQIKIRRYFS